MSASAPVRLSIRIFASKARASVARSKVLLRSAPVSSRQRVRQAKCVLPSRRRRSRFSIIDRGRSQPHRPEVLEIARRQARAHDVAVALRQADELQRGDGRLDGVRREVESLDELVEAVALLRWAATSSSSTVRWARCSSLIRGGPSRR